MRKSIGWAAIGLTTLGLAGAAWANNKSTSSATGDASKTSKASDATACSSDDARLREVFAFLHASNQAEIKLGKLAQDKAHDADVKSFADQMVKEHTDADKKLSDLAQKENIELTPSAVTSDPLFAAIKTTHEGLNSQLSSKSGQAFDVAYIAPQGLDHELVLNVISVGDKLAKDQDEKTFLADAHKTVSMHRDHAKQLQEKLQLPPKAIGGGPSGATTSPDGASTTSKGSTRSNGTKGSTGGAAPSKSTSGTGASDTR